MQCINVAMQIMLPKRVLVFMRFRVNDESVWIAAAALEILKSKVRSRGFYGCGHNQQ
jgi:hypothetical protein